VVELELLQRCERPVALLFQGNPLLFLRPRLLEAIVLGRRLAQEGPRDEQHAGDGEQAAQDEPD